jgi:hypothetical protein
LFERGGALLARFLEVARRTSGIGASKELGSAAPSDPAQTLWASQTAVTNARVLQSYHFEL